MRRIRCDTQYRGQARMWSFRTNRSCAFWGQVCDICIFDFRALFLITPLSQTGLVTSDGPLWKKQRLLVSHMFKNELLDDVVSMASRAGLPKSLRYWHGRVVDHSRNPNQPY
jgi:hypothetical protein